MIQQKQIKSKEPIPQFKDTQEEAEFWDTHDVGEYLNDFERIDVDQHRDNHCPANENRHAILQTVTPAP